MQTHLSIGENHRFELHEALLIYRDRQSSFITHHDVTVRIPVEVGTRFHSKWAPVSV